MMKKIKDPRLISMVVAAIMMGISYDTVSKRCKAGLIKRVNLNPQGKRPVWRVELSSVEGFIKDNS